MVHVPGLLAADLSNSSLCKTSRAVGEVALYWTTGACNRILLEVQAFGVLLLRLRPLTMWLYSRLLQTALAGRGGGKEQWH